MAESIELTKEQIAEIDALYISSYGKKIPYEWHKAYTAYSGVFDASYFPELICISEFERYMNQNWDYCNVFENKNIFYQLIDGRNDIRIPKTYVSCSDGYLVDGYHNHISEYEMQSSLYNLGRVFIKPTVDTCSGHGCAILDFHNGIDTISGKDIGSIFAGIGDNYIVQECIECDKTISDIYDKSANTFRIMTYRWKDEIRSVKGVLRIGKDNSIVDNACAGGIFIGIQDDGRLNKYARNVKGDIFEGHPNSNIIFENYIIEGYSNVLSVAKKMHGHIPQIGVVCWDLTIDKQGKPVLIEANMNYIGIWIFQMCHGCGPFGDNTSDVLCWMKFMRSIGIEDRRKYQFGNMS